MKLINWVTHPSYDIPLPQRHRFTSSKFSDLLTELQCSSLIKSAKVNSPSKASEDDLLVAHCATYISKIKFGSILKKEERKLGLTWSPELSNRSFLAVNGTLLTAKLAIENGVACHLAGGTHHAHYDFGSGFCVFNDLAYTSIHLVRGKVVKKILIFDCDVHQGDGTANILAGNSNIFTCSIHSRKNFPAIKAKSDLDIELEDEMENQQYQSIIESTLIWCVNFFRPDLVLYDAGIDVHKNDALGRLNISNEGCLSRDLFVLSYLKKHSIPVATVIGGGYSKDRIELANRHSIIFKAAHEVYS
tara:strand:- start:916 stop:1824 length:909 start_codon:yes stop_codon:yes gene_type:complete